MFFIPLCKASNEASTDYVLLPDSSNFVRSSLLITSPGKEAYSALGHCAIRMECPPYGLDYCFSFEMGDSSATFNYLRFFSGNTPAGFRAITTDAYIQGYKEEGRGIKEYELNLNLHQKQELWRYLDEDMIGGAHRKFNFIQNNCASMCMIALERNTLTEYLDIKRWPEQHKMINGDGICYLTRNAPWLQFALMSIVGNEADRYWENEYRISPELIAETLSETYLRDVDGNERPILTGKTAELSKQKFHSEPAPITPVIAFTILLIVVIVFTVLERVFSKATYCRILDPLLLTVQTLGGLLLVYMTLVTCMFGLHWNWCLLLFNPIPFIMWLLFHKKKGFRKSYFYYSLVLLFFIALTPLITCQILLSHRLFALSLLIRCLSKWKCDKKGYAESF